MPSCELCGREGPVLSAMVDSAELQVCRDCAKYGTIKKQSTIERSMTKVNTAKPAAPEPVLIQNISSILRSVRETRKLNQEEFASLIQEKESQVKSWETGTQKPNISTAKKLEKILGLRLTILEEQDQAFLSERKNPHEMTLGDFIKVRKR